MRLFMPIHKTEELSDGTLRYLHTMSVPLFDDKGAVEYILCIAEDVTRRVGVMQRLLATMASGVLAWWLTDYAITRVDVWGADREGTMKKLAVIDTDHHMLGSGGGGQRFTHLRQPSWRANLLATTQMMGGSTISAGWCRCRRF